MAVLPWNRESHATHPTSYPVKYVHGLQEEGSLGLSSSTHSGQHPGSCNLQPVQRASSFAMSCSGLPFVILDRYRAPNYDMSQA